MKLNDDGSYELTDAERITKEWHCSLLDAGYSHGAATEKMMLYTPVNGAVWEVLGNDDFRKHLYGIRFWGPLAKDDDVVLDKAIPRIAFLTDEGTIKREATVRRLGPDLYVIKDPDNDMEHLVTTQDVRDDDYLAFLTEAGKIEKPPHECDTDKDLEFQGEIGAPGIGQAWKCRVCDAPWAKLGNVFYRPGDDEPEMMKLSDLR
jgi:hypothetical protein